MAHWRHMVSTWVNIGSGNGLVPVRDQALTNAGSLLIDPSEIWIKIQ